jgi:site-specific recombinase XerD
MATIRERTKKDGTIYYEFTAFLGETKGKQVRKYKFWTPPLTKTGKTMTKKAAEKEAQSLADEWAKELRGGNIATEIITISKMFELWDKQHLETTLEKKTADNYRKLWKRVEPYIGFIKSDEINVRHINGFYLELQKKGANEKTGGGLCVNHYHRMLSSMFNWAIRNEHMIKNPCENASKPKYKSKAKAVFDFEQAQILLHNLTNESLEFQLQISILLTCGLRKGELFAIKESDILPNGILRVSRSISYVAGEEQFEKSTKTEDIRHIRLSNNLLSLLEQYRIEQAERIINLGDLFDNQGYLFTQNNGKPRHIDSISTKFKQYLRKCGFSEELVKGIHLHSLRDTFASLLLASGADVRTTAGLLGHSQPTLTLNVYGQFLPSQWGAAADIFNGMMLPASG